MAEVLVAKKTVVVIDDDRDIAEVVQTVLLDEGFKVSCLYDPNRSDLKAAIDRMEPDCVLLDGGNPAAYGPSWDIASWLASRPRPIPAVMLTAHSADREEAMLGDSARARQARIAGVIPKPFDIDQLVTVVHNAVDQEVTMLTDREEADHETELLERLRAAGADEVRGSKIGRVWATFRAGEDHSLYKVYRWRMAGAYFVGRYSPDGHQMQPLGQFTDLEALLQYCLGRIKGFRLS
jgi:CheY-like chemotaxis protein